MEIRSSQPCSHFNAPNSPATPRHYSAVSVVRIFLLVSGLLLAIFCTFSISSTQEFGLYSIYGQHQADLHRSRSDFSGGKDAFLQFNESRSPSYSHSAIITGSHTARKERGKFSAPPLQCSKPDLEVSLVPSAANKHARSKISWEPYKADPDNTDVRAVEISSAQRFCHTPENCLPAMRGKWFMFMGDSVCALCA
jgi:hypothetical protein